MWQTVKFLSSDSSIPSSGLFLVHIYRKNGLTEF